MYTAFFGFKENPFNLTPDPRYLFLSRYHREALEHLRYGINERKGFIAITGGIGTGKTTLCRALLDHLGAETKSALIFSSFMSDLEMLKAINHEFGIEMGSDAVSKKDYVDALNTFLLNNFSHGGNALLLIDEAQNLDLTVLEQIRMLSNLETEKEKLLQVVLVGQSELKDLLQTSSLRQLNERITVRYELRPLDDTDLRGYVHHRLTVAGGKGEVGFSNRALTTVYTYSQGNPRRINAVCDRALLIAFTDEKRMVSRKMVKDAIRDLKGDGNTQSTSLRPPGFARDKGIGPWLGAATLFLCVLLAAGAFVWYQDGHFWGVFSKTKRLEATPEAAAPAPVQAVTPTSESTETPHAALFLNETVSLANLFRSFERRFGRVAGPEKSTYLGLMTFTIPPEYFTLFKRPFKMLVADLPPAVGTGPRYLLITKTNESGATVLDGQGTPHAVDRDFVLSHWGGAVSFVYPQAKGGKTLTRGMEGRKVSKVQQVLQQVGYLVEGSGVYDGQTARAVTQFQREFGLNADGIVGPRTMALLFQMADGDDELYP